MCFSVLHNTNTYKTLNRNNTILDMYVQYMFHHFIKKFCQHSIKFTLTKYIFIEILNSALRYYYKLVLILYFGPYPAHLRQLNYGYTQ